MATSTYERGTGRRKCAIAQVKLLKGSGEMSRYYAVKPEIRRMVRYSRLNLLGEWPMKGKFDVIFCRNVMIYFDKATQESLVNRYRDILRPGGILLVGHSESLTRINHSFKYVQDTSSLHSTPYKKNCRIKIISIF